MIRILLHPPALVAVYLVAINWAAMYSRPDTIAIPILFELMAFAVHFARALAVYLCLVVPTAYITFRLSGSRLGGIVLAPLLALALTLYTVLADTNYSWNGTISSRQLSAVVVPVLALSLYGYHLIAQRLLGSPESPALWIKPSNLRKTAVLLATMLLYLVGVGAYWNQTPPHEYPALTDDPALEGEALLEVQALVIAALIEKPGGLIRYRGLPPAAALDNMQHWELGAQKQIAAFVPLLESFTFFTIENPWDPQATHLKVPLRLQQANYKIGLVAQSAPGEVESLYRDALRELEQVRMELIPPGVTIVGNGRPADWIKKSSGSLGAYYSLVSAGSNIGQALTPAKYSPRRPALLAIQPLWAENDALYEFYGAAWALGHYLRAVEQTFRELFEEKRAVKRMEEVVQTLDTCQSTTWTPPLLLRPGIEALRAELSRAADCSERVRVGLYHLAEALESEAQ